MQTEYPLATIETEPIESDVLSVAQNDHPDDAWVWCALYRDFDPNNPDTYLPEYEHDGTAHGWADIDQSRLDKFVLYAQRDHLRTHVLQVSETSRPIFFRRRRIELNIATDETQGRSTVHVLGYQRTVRGVNVKFATGFHEDGSVTLTDDLDSL